MHWRDLGSCLQQPVNVRIKLRNFWSRKWADKNSSKQFLWIELVWIYRFLCSHNEQQRENSVTCCKLTSAVCCKHDSKSLYSRLSLNGHLYKTDTSVKRTLSASPKDVHLRESWLYFLKLIFLQVVFVPMWIVLSLLCLLVLYYIIWSIIFVRTAEVLPAQRRGHVMVAVASVLLVIPLLTFQVI